VSPEHHVWCGDLYANYWSGSQPVINRSGWFTGAGVDVGYNPVYCGVIDVRGGSINSVGQLNCTNVSAGNQVYAGNGFTGGTFFGASIQSQGQCYAGGGYTGGSFRGAGVDVGGAAVYCGYVTTLGRTIDTGILQASNYVNAYQILINGTQKCTPSGVWTGSVQCYDNVFGNQFGVTGVATGWNGSFYDRDGNYHVVRGGIITNN
jgi:hypothetical protein